MLASMNEKPIALNPVQFHVVQSQAFVYGWWRISEQRYLYIDVSTNGMKCFNKHSVIGKLAPVAQNDEFHFWQVDLLNEPTMDSKHAEVKRGLLLFELKDRLVLECKPEFNIVAVEFTERQMPCEQCATLFMASRSWQKYCSKGCREKAFRLKNQTDLTQDFTDGSSTTSNQGYVEYQQAIKKVLANTTKAQVQP